MTVSDKIKISVKIGNLNSYSLNVKLTSSPPSDGGINYTIPTGTFTVRSRTAIIREIILSASQITEDQTFITIGVSAVYNGITF
jgi:hypothetical protein